MIADASEYRKAREELQDLEQRLARLQASHPASGEKGFTKVGVRKMIARLYEELAAYEGGEEARRPDGP